MPDRQLEEMLARGLRNTTRATDITRDVLDYVDRLEKGKADPKPWWRSRTIIGAGVAAAAPLLLVFGLEVDQTTLTDELVAIGGVIAAAFAIHGRVRASRPIRRKGGGAAPRGGQ